MSHLSLFVPEWQGYAVDNGPELGARFLRQSVFGSTRFHEISIPERETAQKTSDIMEFDSVCKILTGMRSEIEGQQPASIFTLGGTCGIETIPVTWLNQRHNGDLAVIWLDAHGDLNTPDSSPSGHFHGMPVRAILGQGDKRIRDLMFGHLKPSQIFQVGVRDLDPPEIEYINQQAVRTYDSNLDIESLANDIRQTGFTKLYLHFDLDVLDPQQFQDMIFHVPNGMARETALEIVQHLSHEFNVVGSSLLEYVPRGDTHLEFIARLAEKLMPKS